MQKLSIEMFTTNRPALNQAGSYYVIAKEDRDISKVKIAQLWYPTEILEEDIDEIPFMWLLEDKQKDVNSKDYLFGPEVVVPVNIWHLELLLEALNEDKLLMWNSDYNRLKEKVNLKKRGKDYVFNFGKGLLYDLEEIENNKGEQND